tara:strand:- start:6418 stop:7617 length:1200 start_codon:yes stop_codon:yes gene_type:complete
MIQEEIDDSLEEADCPGEEGVCIEPPDSNAPPKPKKRPTPQPKDDDSGYEKKYDKHHQSKAESLQRIVQEELKAMLREASEEQQESPAAYQQRMRGGTRKQRAQARPESDPYALKKYTPEQKQQILANPNANKGAFINLLRQDDKDAHEVAETPKYRNLRAGLTTQAGVTGTGLEKTYRQSPSGINNILNYPTRKNPETGKAELTAAFKDLLKQGHPSASGHKVMKDKNIRSQAKGITWEQTQGDAERERQATVQQTVDPKDGSYDPSQAEAPIVAADLDKSEASRFEQRQSETDVLQAKADQERAAHNAALDQGPQAVAPPPKARPRPRRPKPTPKPTPEQAADIANINQAEAEAAYASTETATPGMIGAGHEQQASTNESLIRIVNEEYMKLLSEMT